MSRLSRAGAFAFGAILLCLGTLAPSQHRTPSPQNFVLEGNKDFFEGHPTKALAAYQKALRVDARSLRAWLNGAAVWGDLGNLENAAEWYRRAADLSPGDPKIAVALAEIELRRRSPEAARGILKKILAAHPKDVHALVALGRTQLTLGNPKDALPPLARAVRLAPDLTLAQYYLGRAREETGDDPGAIEAYREASVTDSYFTSARYRLSAAHLRLNEVHEAWTQISKLIRQAPHNKAFRHLERYAKPLLRDSPRPLPAPLAARGPRRPLPLVPPPHGEVPRLRIGVGTTGMGKPLAWKDFTFVVKSDFQLRSTRSGRVLAKGKRSRKWSVSLKKRRYLEVRDEKGKRVLRTTRAFSIRPDLARGSWTYFKEKGGKRGKRLARTLRGELEISAHPLREGMRIVNIVDLESYTQGVLTAEMPISSPIEALKAQAVIARTHALFIKNHRRRHHADGYELCDGQHCQVYYGVGSETERSREIVYDTRGRVLTYRGREAHVLYSSNCGGHTQSASDIQGWGEVPYFKGVRDSAATTRHPSSPWQLRQWLRASPKTFCSPSKYVYPSHYRWSRVIPAKELEARLNRSVSIGRLEAIVPLRRAASGHLNSILVRGSRGSREIKSEMRIRGLFGVGSQRSSLFIVDTIRGADLRPSAFVFYGGGWGHGVGMCQSGAMGRAEKGQDYAEILQAYYRGTEIGNLRY